MSAARHGEGHARCGESDRMRGRLHQWPNLWASGVELLGQCRSALGSPMAGDYEHSHSSERVR